MRVQIPLQKFEINNFDTVSDSQDNNSPSDQYDQFQDNNFEDRIQGDIDNHQISGINGFNNSSSTSDQKNLSNQNQEENDIKDIKEIEGKIYQLARSNNGSRTLQRFFHHCHKDDIDSVINECYDVLPHLVIDPYGNYMFQSLIQVSTVEQRQKILKKISQHIPQLVYDKKGTHSLQTLISLINFEEEVQLISHYIKDKVKILSQHNNATHFIQKIILCFDVKYLDYIFVAITEDIESFGNDPHSLCVLKAFMTKIKNTDSKIIKIIKLLEDNNDKLIQSPYGNYAIQHAYMCYGEEKCEAISQKILQRITQFSIQKYSSNVIEKCISSYCINFRYRAICEILKCDTIQEFMKNKYGNFILHKLLVLSINKPEFNYLIDQIQKNISNIHMTKFKNKWINFLERGPIDPYSQQQFMVDFSPEVSPLNSQKKFKRHPRGGGERHHNNDY